LGDFLDYWLAQRYGEKIIRKIYRRGLDLSFLRRHMENHAALTIALTRFTGT